MQYALDTGTKLTVPEDTKELMPKRQYKFSNKFRQQFECKSVTKNNKLSTAIIFTIATTNTATTISCF